MTENRGEPTRFQKRTIDYVIRRFWDDAEPARRFLVADEVGLGKTVVAREVLAEALRRRSGECVDIVYLCSSQPVASQNLKRLKVRGHGGTRKATRLTMLALEPATPDGVRYFALTPDTSFKVSGKSGTVRERALIHACLRRTLRGDRFNAVIRQVSAGSWERETAKMAAMTLDRRVVDAFREAVRADGDLLEDVRGVGRDILEAPQDERLERGLKRRRDEVVGRLRRHLAIHSAQAMASNGLVIVDEFQRFATLFDTRRIDTDIAVRLVDSLLSRSVPDRRVLLLSATPYRIPGAETVPGQTPYADFVTLVGFLADEPTAVDLAEALDRYAQALRSNPPEVEAIVAARNDARAILRPIMCRTERTGAESNPNAMVREETRALDLRDGDLAGAVSARRIARRLKVRDPVEYWKSAPFLLDFMRDYQFRTSVNDVPEGDRPFVGRQARHGRLVLDKPALKRLDPLAVPSARLGDLVDDAMPAGSERLLWTPPSLPYVKPGGEYARSPNDLKRLVFTEWRLAPDAIAALTSYVVEQSLDAGLRASHAKRTRRSDGGQGLRHKRFGDLGNMLRLGRANQGADEPTLAMLPLLLLLSGQRMADWGDPLPHAIEAGRPAEPAAVLRAAAAHVRSALRQLPPSTSTGRVDERWYWAAPLLLEGAPSLYRWLAEDDPFLASGEATPPDLERVRAAISAIVEDPGSLGRRPRDLAQVVAKTAVAAPGACAYRALRRTASGPVKEADLRRAAFHVARGFQSLFNQSEAAAAVQLEQPGRKRVFWDQVLDYSLSGNLQAVLDEHLHFEADGLAMFDGTNAEKLQMAAKAVHTALTLRRASIDVRGLGRPRAAGSEDRDLVRLRCRHGARFAEVKEPNGEVSRLDVVRGAFNSPFRPFVLASTAVGQEGLDFHPWCHAVVHWNLPRSPVELEQREGRVHRYKGHAVRLNVASAIGLGGLATAGAVGDPWQALFNAAALQDTENELSPCWLFEPSPEAVRIRRIVPFLRYSREEEAWPRLRARLATYRLALGLPRADDLLEALERNGVTAEQSAEWKIDLHPPPARVRSV